MLAEKKTLPINLREGTGYLFILTLLLLAGLFVWMMARMFEPRADWRPLGTLSELASDTPQVFYLVTSDERRASVWISFADGQWYAFDGVTPDPYNSHCLFGWQTVTNRFEDPCTGMKYTRAGEFINESYYARDVIAQDLTRYPLSIENDTLAVNLAERIIGKKWRAISTPSLLP